MEQEKKHRGGARPGAGRKPGRRSLPENERTMARTITLRAEEWDELDALADRLDGTRSLVIREALPLLRAKLDGDGGA